MIFTETVEFDLMGWPFGSKKIPLDADTKMQSLKNVSSYISPSANDPALQQNKQFTQEELERAREYGFKVQSNAPKELELAEVNAP